MTRWHLLLLALQGHPWPALPALPGRVILCRDEPMSEAELADVTSPTELGLLLGVSRQRAHQLIQQRAEQAHNPKDEP